MSAAGVIAGPYGCTGGRTRRWASLPIAGMPGHGPRRPPAGPVHRQRTAAKLPTVPRPGGVGRLPCKKGTHSSAPPRPAKGKTIKEELKQVVDKAEDVTNSRVLEVLARSGFAVSGILHLLVGAIAIRLAMGGTGHADFSGAVAELATMAIGPFLLWGSFAACTALSLWQAGDAIFD